MDTSKEYIEMCEKVEDIQTRWEPKYGDIYVWAENTIRKKRKKAKNIYSIVRGMDAFKKDIVCAVTGPTNERRHRSQVVWLPRLDQLQGMIPISRGYSYWQPMYDLIMWALPSTDEMKPGGKAYTIVNQFTSMEQLWLAFVMRKKYGKVWNGKEWVAEA
jgi:hypothetical protein